MSDYTVYLSNGTRLLDLVPLRIDTTTTSLGLQGDATVPRNGQLNPTNLVHLLENFANATPPANPIIGQIWYNTTLQACTVWNGTLWTGVGGAVAGPTGPTGPAGPQGLQGPAGIAAELAETQFSQIQETIRQLTDRIVVLETK